ncbi:NAD-dependent epimerase/dehydratase family protein [Pedobacter frigiditerrae]|uniref:NAD-dependent epimerase/dehydratase family protein n=1 Tax=Pedobacter frigiditerrae TaxID=2530452 RepID=A0A4R0MRB6_9SPHI|nr:NAD(P)H-binding protein [Pedobacter frigiditerrae]TCC89430.1 NAD-dependent epimerase/dehydratase family protein [Pedobacter frigiditerrae]
MKVAILGATGFVGTAIFNELLSRGNEVIAIARNLDKIESTDEKLTKVAVDVLDKEQLAAALKGADAVVSAFNAGWTNPNLYNDTITGATAIQEAVKLSGVKRYIFIGGAGTLEIDGNQLVDAPQFPAEIYPGASAVRDYFNTLKQETELDWLFFSPAIEMHPGITIGRTGKYRLGKTSPVFNEEGRSILSVEDLAIVIADELENKAHHQEQFTAAY